jgi:hypothetical protein
VHTVVLVDSWGFSFSRREQDQQQLQLCTAAVSRFVKRRVRRDNYVYVTNSRNTARGWRAVPDDALDGRFAGGQTGIG